MHSTSSEESRTASDGETHLERFWTIAQYAFHTWFGGLSLVRVRKMLIGQFATLRIQSPKARMHTFGHLAHEQMNRERLYPETYI